MNKNKSQNENGNRGETSMGRMMAHKIREMKWMEKISLVLIFTLIFSAFMHQGWYMPKQASAAVAVGSEFGATNVAAGTGAMTAISGTYTVGAGSNRLLVVVAQWETNAAGDTSSFTSGTWGGQNLTSLTLYNSAVSRNRQWVGYMKEAQIAAASGTTLNLNIANSAAPNGWTVKAAWFTGVDQTTPINHFVNSNNEAPGGATHTFGGTALNVINGGIAYYFETTNSGVTYTAPGGYTERYDGNDPSANFAATAGSKAIGADGTENPTITQSAATRYTVTAISLNPLSGDQVNVTDGTDPANYTVYAGDTDKVADGFTMATNANSAVVTAVTVSLTNSANVSGIRLYRDAGTIGTYDSGVDTLISTGTSGATVSFTGLTENLTTTTTNYLIVVDIAGGATQGQTVVATVTALTVTSPDSQGTVTDSGTTLTIGTPAMTVSGLADYPAPASVQQGQNNVAMMKFTLATNAGSVTWTAGTLDKTGTNGQLGAVTYDMYYDANGNGIFESGSDTLILSADPFTLATADPYTLTLPQTITTTPKTYFIVYDLSATATTATTVGARIVNNAYFTVTGGTVAGVASTSSGTPTINAGTCVRSAPSVSMGSDGSVSVGGNKVYTVTVTNNDNVFCGSSTFTLSLASETGNTGSFTLPSSLAPTTTGALAPGAVYNSSTLTVVAQAGATVGHTLTTTINASDGANHAAQTGSGMVTTTVASPWSNSAMLHNSTNLNSNKWGANGWGIPGGKYGAFVCETCHTKTTANIKRVKGTVTVPDTSQGNIPGSTVNFQTVTTPNGFGDNNLTHATSQRICEVCHTATAYHKYNQTAVNHEMPNGYNDCTYCHPHTQGFKPLGCIDCHSQQQGSRAAVVGQFSGSSHHIQGVAVTNQLCYQCHWEANSDGSVNGTYHGGWAAPGSAVDLVTNWTATRPTVYAGNNVQYTANGTRAELQKINTHCLGCHDDDSSTAQPFGDGKTPKQYAWDGTSVNARYSQPGTTTWGKYTTASYPNAAKKNITKAYSAHGNATSNQRGWDTTNGVDGTITNTANGAYNVLCFDCHNSHGSSVSGTTTSYTSATTNGGILKDTTAGKGGYAMTYKPQASDGTGSRVACNAGASLCFDCHMTANAGTTPWGYQGTFGATQMIIGYLEKPGWKGAAGTNPSGAQQRYAFKNNRPTVGGHFGASSALNTTPMGTINGLCTPCHDPHGTSTTLGANQVYGVPLLKGTWVTSPYKEDAAPANTNEQRGGGSGRSAPGPTNVGSTPGYHIDQNTLGSSALPSTAPYTWNFYNLTTAGTQKITQTDAQFAGLCLSCHPKSQISPDSSQAWQGYDRIHNTVQGWGGQGANANNAVHGYTCSKCHTPHSSCLPRLAITNCLDYKHRGRVISGGTVRTGSNTYTGRQSGSRGLGNGRYPGGGGGNGDQPDDWSSGGGAYFFGNPGPNNSTYSTFRSCHDTPNGGTWPNNQQWNSKTPW